MTPDVSTAERSGVAWRLLKVRRGEGAKVLAFVGLAALLQTGIAMGLTAADALFIANVGVGGLPAVYMLVPALMLVYVPLTGWLLGRFGVHRTLQGTLLVLALGGGLFFTALSGVVDSGGVEAGPRLVYYAAKLYASLWYIGLYSLYWNFADAYFDLQDAKRLFALFSAGSALGSIVGGALVASAASPGQLRTLYLVWAACALITLPVVSAIVRRYRPLDDWLPDDGLSFAEQIAATRAAFGRSPLVRYLMLALVMSLLLTTIAEYQYLGIFSQERSEVELAALIGGLFALVNGFNLIITLFVFSRLVLKLGVTQVALIQPAVYLVTFLFLLLQGGMAAAVFGFFAYQGVLTSIEYNNQNFLFRAVPARVKKQVRTAIEGFAEPLATALGGALLFLLRDRVSPLGLSAIGVAAALVYLALVLRLRVHYVPSIVKNLREGWLDLAQPPEQRLRQLDPDEVDELRHQVTRASDGSTARAALRLLWLHDPVDTVDVTLDVLEREPTAASGFESTWLAEFTRHADAAQRARLAAWARDHLTQLPSPVLLTLAAEGVLGRDALGGIDNSRASDLAALQVIEQWRAPDDASRLEARTQLEHRLAGTPAEVRRALAVVAALGDPELVRPVARLLDHDAPDVRTGALDALAQSTAQQSDVIGRQLLRAMREARGADQALALRALGRIRNPEGVPALLRAAERFGPARRREALQVLQSLGPAAVPGTVRVLRDAEAPRSSRVLAARVLAEVALAQLVAISDELVERELTRARDVRCARRLLRNAAAGRATSPERAGLDVLARVLADRQVGTVDFVLEVLSLEGRLPDFDLLAASLRSRIPRERASALETIEEGVPAPLFDAISDLLASDAGGGAAGAVGASPHDPPGDPADFESLLHDALQSSDAVEVAAAAFALVRRDPGRYRIVVGDRLRHTREPILRATVLALATPETPETLETPAGATPIEVLAELLRAPAFSRLPVSDLEALVREVRPMASEDVAEPGQTPLDARIALVVDGWIACSDGRRYEAGEVAGLEQVFGAGEPLRVVAGSGRWLALPVEALRGRARTHSRVAVELVSHLAETGHVAIL